MHYRPIARLLRIILIEQYWQATCPSAGLTPSFHAGKIKWHGVACVIKMNESECHFFRSGDLT